MENKCMGFSQKVCDNYPKKKSPEIDPENLKKSRDFSFGNFWGKRPKIPGFGIPEKSHPKATSHKDGFLEPDGLKMGGQEQCLNPFEFCAGLGGKLSRPTAKKGTIR